MNLKFLQESSYETLDRIDRQRELSELAQRRSARRAIEGHRRSAADSRFVAALAAGALLVSGFTASIVRDNNTARQETEALQPTATLVNTAPEDREAVLRRMCDSNPSILIGGVAVCETLPQESNVQNP